MPGTADHAHARLNWAQINPDDLERAISDTIYGGLVG